MNVFHICQRHMLHAFLTARFPYCNHAHTHTHTHTPSRPFTPTLLTELFSIDLCFGAERLETDGLINDYSAKKSSLFPQMGIYYKHLSDLLSNWLTQKYGFV